MFTGLLHFYRRPHAVSRRRLWTPG